MEKVRISVTFLLITVGRFLVGEGEEGAVCSLPEVSYLARIEGGQAVLLTRAHRWRLLDINPAEFTFKAAVLGMT